MIDFYTGMAIIWIIFLAILHTHLIYTLKSDIRFLKSESREREKGLQKEIIDLHKRVLYLEAKIKDRKC